MESQLAERLREAEAMLEQALKLLRSSPPKAELACAHLEAVAERLRQVRSAAPPLGA